MNFRIADTFTTSLARLTGDEQKSVKTTAFDLQLNPASPGHSFHKLDRARDRKFWSVRVSRDIRLIVHKDDQSLLLCSARRKWPVSARALEGCNRVNERCRSMTQTVVIGVDCAVNPKNNGLALATWTGGTMVVEELVRGAPVPGLVATMGAWIGASSDHPVLLALDAPLGWPAPLAEALSDHSAGRELNRSPDAMFRRATDDFVWQKVGKRPLDVGADRIARTSHAALRLLHDLRQETDSDIPLAWSSRLDKVSAIEVYPAATLMAHRIQRGAYKHAAGIEDRLRIASALGEKMDFREGVLNRPLSSDEIDAAACLLAAQDFLSNNAFEPPNPEQAAKEGWIWVRQLNLTVEQIQSVST